MSPIKGDGSSHRMGKEVAANDPPTKTMGEEAPYSKLDHSEEEEEEEGGGVAIWVVSVLLSLTHGTTSLSISP